MWFRILFLILTLIAWAIAFWLADHNSENTDVMSKYSTGYFAFLLLMFSIAIIFTISQFGPIYRWFFRKRKNLITFSVAIIVSIIGMEVIVRALDPIGISYYEHSKQYHLDKLADDDLHYRHRPNVQKDYQDVSVSTNEFGMRDDLVLGKEPGELRILFLGDSVTFGWGTKQEDTFANQSAEVLQEILHRPVRTLNTGVGSYNTVNEAAVLKRYGEKLNPDIVVLLYVGNDTDLITEQTFDPWSKNSFVGKSPPESLNLLVGKSWVYRLVTHLTRYRTGASQAVFSTTSKGWIESIRALQEISEYCGSANIPFVVLMYRMTPNPFENGIAAELDILSNQLNYHFYDVLPWFEGKDIRRLINSPVDSHPNDEGHKILTEGIVDVLQLIVPSSGRRLNERN